MRSRKSETTGNNNKTQNSFRQMNEQSTQLFLDKYLND